MKRTLALAAMLLAPCAALASTYHLASPGYSGISNYTPPCARPPCATYRTSMAITGTFTTDSTLEPDRALASIHDRLTSFRFSDGVNVYASDDPDVRLQAFSVKTDAGGTPVEHIVSLSKWLSGSSPHAYGDRVSELLFKVTTDQTYIVAHHNRPCYTTWTVPVTGTTDACNSMGSDASTSSAGYDPDAPPNFSKRTVVEYFNAAFGHYFITAEPDEITALDGGAFDGAFKRTGLEFLAFDGPNEGTVPVCRFFTQPGLYGAKSSHFYTAHVAECDKLKSGADWIYETVAFHVYPAVGAWCSGQEISTVLRIYNDGQSGAPNHRFTTNSIVHDEFVSARGWISEGAVFCVPASPIIYR